MWAGSRVAEASPTWVAPPGSGEDRKAMDTGSGHRTLCGRSRGHGRGLTHRGPALRQWTEDTPSLSALDWTLSMRTGDGDARSCQQLRKSEARLREY